MRLAPREPAQNTAPTASIPGNTNTAFCRLCQASDSRPMISGLQKSPNRWMTKIDAAIALARNAVGTLSTMIVLIGPVGRKSRNIAAAK